MFKITFFLLFLAVLAVKGNEVEVADDYDPTVPMTCFIITPKPCARAAYEIVDFFQLPDNAYPGLMMRPDPRSEISIGATFFDAKNEFISEQDMTDLTHRDLLSFFEENNFPLFDFDAFDYSKSIHVEFDWGGHHYLVALMRVPYFIATELANKREHEVNGKMEKGYLVQIESKEESDAVREHLELAFEKLLGFGVWLGGHKNMDKEWHWENGQFDGQKFFDYNTQESEMYTEWEEGRPFQNDRNTDRCAVWSKRGWSDVNCFVDTRSVVFEFGTDPQVYEKKEVEEVEVVVEEEVEREEL